MKKRFERLILTFIAKKYVAWVVATYLLTKGYILGEAWVALTFGIFAIDAYSKEKLMKKEPENIDMSGGA